VRQPIECELVTGFVVAVGITGYRAQRHRLGDAMPAEAWSVDDDVHIVLFGIGSPAERDAFLAFTIRAEDLVVGDPLMVDLEATPEGWRAVTDAAGP
jgi:hypothetical protein